MGFSQVVICSVFIRHTNMQPRATLEILASLISKHLYLRHSNDLQKFSFVIERIFSISSVVSYLQFSSVR